MIMNSGFLLIDKPAGMTSHDVIDELRRRTGIKKIGHAGTLDPFATGLLFVAIGREATRELGKFVGCDKTYEAEFVLGATTATLDTESEVEKSGQVVKYSGGQVTLAMQRLTGEIEQVPPMHSAIKQGGQRLYKLARQGETIERAARPVTIHRFELMGEPDEVDGTMIIKVEISCSSGTYIRALARDLAQELGTVGYVRTLKRTELGPFELNQANQLADLTAQNWPTRLLTVSQLGQKA